MKKYVNVDYYWEEESALCNEVISELEEVLDEIPGKEIDFNNEDYQRVIAGEPGYVKNFKIDGKVVTSIKILSEDSEFEDDIAYYTEDGEEHLVREEIFHTIINICEKVNSYVGLMY